MKEKWSNISNWIKEHKKQSIIIGVIILVCLIGGITVAVVHGSKQPASVVTEEKEEEKKELEFTSEDLNGVVSGMDGEVYILAGSDVDLLSLLAFDDSIVESVAADTSQLNVTAAGDYVITLEFTVDAKVLCEYLGEDFDSDQYMETSKIQVEKTIKVVDQVTGQGLADAGTPVYTGTGTTMPMSNGTAVEAEVAAPESTAKTGGSSKDGNTTSHAFTTAPTNNTSTNTSSGSGNAGSTGSSGSSGNTGSTGSAGNTGNAGTVGNSGTSGNSSSSGSGNTGTSGNTGNSGNAGSTGGNSGKTGNTGNNGNSGSSGSTGDSGQQTPSQPTHTHTWVAETKEEPVVVEPGYPKPIYEWLYRCKVCGHTDKDELSIMVHCMDECGGAMWEYTQVQTGEEQVPPKTEIQQVPTGRYICSGCGAIK